MTKATVWLVTGCSSGLGTALAKTILAHGDKLIASSRNPSKTPDLVDYVTSRGGDWITLDATALDLEAVIARAEAIHGKIDVVVNNAGYPICGAFEDLQLDDARQQMETNLWGPCRIMLSVLPGMRARRSGTIVNVSSTAGLRVLPTYTHYAASKFALEAVSEGLAQEVAPFGVRVQLIEPGALRTNFLGAGAIQYKPLMSEYRGTVCEEMLARLGYMDGRQVGDPGEAAERIYEVVTGTGMAGGREAELRLPIGSDCIQTVRAKLERVRVNFENYEDLATSTDIKS